MQLPQVPQVLSRQGAGALVRQNTLPMAQCVSLLSISQTMQCLPEACQSQIPKLIIEKSIAKKVMEPWIRKDCKISKKICLGN